MEEEIDTLKKPSPNQVSAHNLVIPGGIQHDATFEPASDQRKITGSNSEADPESTPA